MKKHGQGDILILKVCLPLQIMPSHSSLLHLLPHSQFPLPSFLCLSFFYDRGTLSFHRKEGAMVANLMECEVLIYLCIEHIFIDIFSRLLSEKRVMFSCAIYWLDLWVSKGTKPNFCKRKWSTGTA